MDEGIGTSDGARNPQLREFPGDRLRRPLNLGCLPQTPALWKKAALLGPPRPSQWGPSQHLRSLPAHPPRSLPPPVGLSIQPPPPSGLAVTPFHRGGGRSSEAQVVAQGHTGTSSRSRTPCVSAPQELNTLPPGLSQAHPPEMTQICTPVPHSQRLVTTCLSVSLSRKALLDQKTGRGRGC